MQNQTPSRCEPRQTASCRGQSLRVVAGGLQDADGRANPTDYRRHRGRASGGLQRLAARWVDFEDLIQPGDLENVLRVLVRANDVQGAAAGRGGFDAVDHDAQGRGVEKGDLGEVDDDAGYPWGADQLPSGAGAVRESRAGYVAELWPGLFAPEARLPNGRASPKAANLTIVGPVRLERAASTIRPQGPCCSRPLSRPRCLASSPTRLAHWSPHLHHRPTDPGGIPHEAPSRLRHLETRRWLICPQPMARPNLQKQPSTKCAGCSSRAAVRAT